MSPGDTVEAAAARTGWGTAPLWTIARRVDRTGFPDAELLSVYRDWGVVRKADRDDNFNVESDDLSSYKFVKRGDLVLNKMKTWQGSLGVSDFEGIVSPAYFTCELSPTVHPRFIHYLLRSDLYIAMYAGASKGIRPNQWDLPYEEFRSLEALLPPLEEQRRIADFLDDQVGLVDRVIGHHGKHLSLIDEVERATIDVATSSASSRRLKACVSVLRDGTHLPPPRVHEGVPLYTAKNLRGNQLSPHPADTFISRISADELDRSLSIEPDDVLLSVKGTVGSVARVPRGFPRFQIERNIALLRPKEGVVSSDWLYYSLRSTAAQDQMRLAMGFSAQPGIYLGALGDLRISVPDPSTQKHRVRELADASDATAGIASQVTSSIELLHEYKRSLITAAVTGELDVATARRGVSA